MATSSTVGLDLGARHIKLIRLARGSRQLQVLDYDSEPVVLASADEQAAPGDDEPTQVRPAPEPPSEADGQVRSPADSDPASTTEADVDLSDMAPWEAALARLLARHDLSDAALACAIPGASGMTLRLDMPFGDRNNVAAILPSELEDGLPMSLEAIHYNFRVDTEEPPGLDPVHTAAVGFVGRAELTELLADLKRHDLDPTFVGVPEQLYDKLISRMVGDVDDSKDCFALIDMGHATTRVIVVEGREPQAERTIIRGGHNLITHIATRFGMSEEQAERIIHEHGVLMHDPAQMSSLTEELRAQIEQLSGALGDAFMPLARDLRRTFQSLYARDRLQISKVYLLGGASQLRNVTAYLEREFEVPVERLRPELLVEGEVPPAIDVSSLTALAIGMMESSERGINLRSGEFEARGRSSYIRSQLKRFAAVAAILVVIMGAALYTKLLEMEKQRDAMRTAVSNETKKMFGQPILSSKTLKQKLMGEDETKKGFVPKVSAYELLHNSVTKIKPSIKLKVSRLEVDVDRSLIQIRGTTTSAQEVDAMVTDLEAIECFKEIKKDKLKVRKDQEMDFELQILSECS